jgi:hypothetical protein
MNQPYQIYIVIFAVFVFVFILIYYLYNIYISNQKNISSILKSSNLKGKVTIDLSNSSIPTFHNPTSSMSIWINVGSISSQTDKVYIYVFGFKSGNETEKQIYSLYLDPSTNGLYFKPIGVDENNTSYCVINYLTPNKWNNVVVNIVNNTIFEFYVNAKLENTYTDNTDSLATQIQQISSISTDSVYSNCYLFYTTSSNSPSNYDISIQQFQRNAYALSLTDVLDIYNSGTSMHMPSYNMGYNYSEDNTIIKSGTIF